MTTLLENTENPVTSIGYRVSTIDEIMNYSPSVFCDHRSPKVSDKYSFISTKELIDSFEKFGWTPNYTRQNGKSLYARHTVRLNNDDLGYFNLNFDKVKPQLIVDNSHNGISPAHMHMGLFRLVCTNGLVMAIPGMHTSIRLRHMGVNFEELKSLVEIITNQYNIMSHRLDDMFNTKLTTDQQEEYAIRAIATREPHMFINSDGTVNIGKITEIVNPKQILTPMRGEDKSEDLWTTFNVVQERLVKGFFDRKTPSGRKTNPRGISNATRHTNFNIKLWELTEEYMTN